MNTTLDLRTSTLVLLAAIAIQAAAQTPQFEVMDLGAVNGESEAFEIDDLGRAVGWTFTQDGFRKAVVWRNGGMEVLDPRRQNSAAFGIEEDGVIVGKSGLVATQFHGAGQTSSLGTFGGQESVAFATNLNGEVAGMAQNRNADWRAFAAKANRNLPLVFLGTLGGNWSCTTDVNEVGGYVGWSHTASGPTHATLFARGQRPVDIGTLGGPQSEGRAINDFFWATGWSDTRATHNAPTNRGPVRRAFLWTPESARMTSLGETYLTGKTRMRDANGRYYYNVTLREGEVRRNYRVFSLDTFGEDVNSAGVVCGYARLHVHPAQAKERAVVWVGGRMYDLNDVAFPSSADWILTHAWGLNDGTTVVGRGMNLSTGGIRAFMARRVR